MARMSSVLQYNGTTDTKSKSTFVLLRHPLLLDNMPIYPLVCFLCLYAPLCVILHLFAPLCVFFVSLSSLLLVCQPCVFFCCYMYTIGVRVHTWSKGATSKMQSRKGKECKQEDISLKRAMFCRLRGLSSPFLLCVVISFSPSQPLLQNLVSRLGFHFLVSSFQPHSWGMVMSVLYFLYLFRPYPLDVGAFLYLSCTLLGPHSLGMTMSGLFSYFVCLHCA